VADQRKLFLKLENLQPIGAFKLRGAYNKVASLSDAQNDAAESFPIPAAITRKAWPTQRERWV
jgi:threonine dehydratase